MGRRGLLHEHTLSPGWTATFSTFPGIGEITEFDMSAPESSGTMLCSCDWAMPARSTLYSCPLYSTTMDLYVSPTYCACTGSSPICARNRGPFTGDSMLRIITLPGSH